MRCYTLQTLRCAFCWRHVHAMLRALLPSERRASVGGLLAKFSLGTACARSTQGEPRLLQALVALHSLRAARAKRRGLLLVHRLGARVVARQEATVRAPHVLEELALWAQAPVETLRARDLLARRSAAGTVRYMVCTPAASSERVIFVRRATSGLSASVNKSCSISSSSEDGVLGAQPSAAPPSPHS